MPNLEDRMAALEETVEHLREQVNMEAGLALSRDRDTSDVLIKLRAHEMALNALRRTQVDHGKILADHTHTLKELVAGQKELVAGQQTLVAMLTTLIER